MAIVIYASSRVLSPLIGVAAIVACQNSGPLHVTSVDGPFTGPAMKTPVPGPRSKVPKLDAVCLLIYSTRCRH